MKRRPVSVQTVSAIDVRLAHATRLVWEDEPEKARRTLLACQDRFTSQDLPTGMFHLIMARSSELLGDLAAAQEHSGHAIRIGRLIDSLDLQAEGLELLGKAAYRRNEVAIAVRHFEQAIHVYRDLVSSARAPFPMGLARTQTGMTYALLRQGDLQRALEVLQDALPNARRAADPRALSNALSAAAYTYQLTALSMHPDYVDKYGITALGPSHNPRFLEMVAAGRSCCAEAAQIAKEGGDEYLALIIESNGASFDNLEGEPFKALGKHSAMVAACRVRKEKAMLASALHMEAWSLRLLRRYEQAETRLQEALAICQDIGNRDLLLYLHYDLSVVYELLGNSHLALHHIREFVKKRPVSVAGGSTALAQKRANHPKALRAVLVEAGVSDTHLKPSPVTSHEPGILKRAEQYINSNLHTRITVAELAQFLGVSVRNLQLLFTKHRNQTPSAFVMSTRLRAAQQAIQRGEMRDKNVAQIALGFGFENASRFSRAFKAEFGFSPAKTRR